MKYPKCSKLSQIQSLVARHQVQSPLAPFAKTVP